MDAKGVRNMQSILVVVNKHNTTRVASCWFIIYYITIIFFSQDFSAHGTFEVGPSFSQVINNCPPLFRTNTKTSYLEPSARVLQTPATQSIATLSIVSSDDHPCQLLSFVYGVFISHSYMHSRTPPIRTLVTRIGLAVQVNIFLLYLYCIFLWLKIFPL